jgi:hypothetical protein
MHNNDFLNNSVESSGWAAWKARWRVHASCHPRERKAPRLWKIFAIVLLLNLLDVWTTAHALVASGQDFVELNSTFMGDYVRAGNWYSVLAFKFGCAGVIIGALYLLQKHRSRLFDLAWRIPIIIYSLVVLWNTSQLVLEAWLGR